MKLFAVALLLWSSSALATKVSVAVHPCPLGEGSVKVYDKIAANTFGGFDSDLVSYSSKGQFREYAISTCPDNLLSLLGRDMLVSWSKEDKKTLEDALDKANLGKNWGGTVTERYKLAADLYTALDKEPLFMAELYLEGSWVARDMSVGIFLGLEGPVGARSLITEGAAALQQSAAPVGQSKKLLLHNLTRIAHRGGYTVERDAYLEAFASLPLSPAETETLKQMRNGIALEAWFQDRAIESFKTGLATQGLDMETKTRATYLLADLLRRRGHYTDSFGLFALIISEESAPQNLREMALVLSEEMAETWPELFIAP
jgi:hypothetical protein